MYLQSKHIRESILNSALIQTKRKPAIFEGSLSYNGPAHFCPKPDFSSIHISILEIVNWYELVFNDLCR